MPPRLKATILLTGNAGFAIVRGISNNRFKRLDLTTTRELLGYAPQDDAFDIFQADLQQWLQD